MSYNPYPYNRALQSFFVTGNTSNLDMPHSAVALIADKPQLAQHVNSVWSFIGWLQKSSPALYNAITNQKPELLDPAAVVASGALTPAPKKGAGLNGLSDVAPNDFNIGVDANGDLISTAPTSPTADSGSPITSWGQSILDTIKNVAPSLIQLKTQNDLMNINIKRAEQGLSPIDSTSLAPTVNVGVSSGVQNLGYIAIGGLVIVGLLSAFARRK